MTSNPALDRLSDDVLLCQFGDLIQQDQRRAASLLRHIEAIDQRQLWAKRGHPSMFDFCVSRYHMSESTAGKRIGAARTARRFPVLFAMVARGEIHLSGIHRLKAHLTPENHERVLAEAEHKSIRQIEQLVAGLAPQADVPSTLRALPRRPAAVATSAVTPPEPTAPAAAAPVPSPVPTAQVAPPLAPRRSPDPTPLAPGRYKLQVTLSESGRETLKQLQDLLAHRIPSGDPAAIVERALGVLLTQVHKRKTGITSKPRAQKPKPRATATTTIAARRTRYLEVAVRREVWTRDDGRCGFVGEDGHRCNETHGLQFGHMDPWGKGGADTAVNLGLRCRAHNAWEADRDYGASLMASKRKRKPWKVQEPVARYNIRRVPCAMTAVVARANSRSRSAASPPCACFASPSFWSAQQAPLREPIARTVARITSGESQPSHPRSAPAAHTRSELVAPHAQSASLDRLDDWALVWPRLPL